MESKKIYKSPSCSKDQSYNFSSHSTGKSATFSFREPSKHRQQKNSSQRLHCSRDWWTSSSRHILWTPSMNEKSDQNIINILLSKSSEFQTTEKVQSATPFFEGLIFNIVFKTLVNQTKTPPTSSSLKPSKFKQQRRFNQRLSSSRDWCSTLPSTTPAAPEPTISPGSISQTQRCSRGTNARGREIMGDAYLLSRCCVGMLYPGYDSSRCKRSGEIVGVGNAAGTCFVFSTIFSPFDHPVGTGNWECYGGMLYVWWPYFMVQWLLHFVDIGSRECYGGILYVWWSHFRIIPLGIGSWECDVAMLYACWDHFRDIRNLSKFVVEDAMSV